MEGGQRLLEDVRLHLEMGMTSKAEEALDAAEREIGEDPDLRLQIARWRALVDAAVRAREEGNASDFRDAAPLLTEAVETLQADEWSEAERLLASAMEKLPEGATKAVLESLERDVKLHQTLARVTQVLAEAERAGMQVIERRELSDTNKDTALLDGLVYEYVLRRHEWERLIRQFERLRHQFQDALDELNSLEREITEETLPQTRGRIALLERTARRVSKYQETLSDLPELQSLKEEAAERARTLRENLAHQYLNAAIIALRWFRPDRAAELLQQVRALLLGHPDLAEAYDEAIHLVALEREIQGRWGDDRRRELSGWRKTIEDGGSLGKRATRSLNNLARKTDSVSVRELWELAQARPQGMEAATAVIRPFQGTKRSIQGGPIRSVAVPLVVGLLFILLSAYSIAVTNNRAHLEGELAARSQELAARSEDLVIADPDLPERVVVAKDTRKKLSFAITTNANESAPDGTVVRFEAVGGEVDPLATTQEGQAKTTFRPTQEEGEAVIVVSVGGAERAFTIPLAPPPKLAKIDVVPERTRLLADGQEQTRITLRAIDDAGNPMAGVPIKLRVEPQGAGSLSPSEVQTADNGEAAVTVTSGTQPISPTTIIAEAQDGSHVSSTSQLELVADVAQLQVTPSRTEVWNTGSEEVVLIVALQDGLGRPLADTAVNLAITGGEAWFLEDGAPIQDTNTIERGTDGEGQAAPRCRFGETPGPVTIDVQAEGQKETVTIAINELKPTEIGIQPDRQNLLIGADTALAAATLTITVRDQRGEEVPQMEVTLALDPPDSSIAQLTKESVVTGGTDKAVVQALSQPGEVTVKATAGEATGSTTLRVVQDSDEDGRYDYRETALGTRPDVADDIVKTAGALRKKDADVPIIEGLPPGTVLTRADFARQQGHEAVRLLLWVHPDGLGSQEESAQPVLKPGATIVVAQDLPESPELRATEEAGGYPVRDAAGETEVARPGPEWRLVQIEGLFPIEHLDRP